MNKIIVNGDKISLDINSSLDVEVIEKKDVFDITKIKINTLKSTSLVIEYNSIDEAKLDIIIEVKENDYLKLYELRCEDKIKVQYKYYLNRNSNLLVNKFYDCNKVKELDVIYLNGEFANVDYNYMYCFAARNSNIYDFPEFKPLLDKIGVIVDVKMLKKA